MSMQSSKSPCYLRDPCPDRKPGCHASCKKFKEWSAEEAKKKEVIRKNKLLEIEIRRQEIERKRRLMKGRKKS